MMILCPISDLVFTGSMPGWHLLNRPPKTCFIFGLETQGYLRVQGGANVQASGFTYVDNIVLLNNNFPEGVQSLFEAAYHLAATICTQKSCIP